MMTSSFLILYTAGSILHSIQSSVVLLLPVLFKCRLSVALISNSSIVYLSEFRRAMGRKIHFVHTLT